MATTFRPDRAAEAIRAAVARAVTSDIQDPRLLGVTITQVDVSRDLSFARVFYTIMGDDEAKDKAQKGFESAASFLRRVVAQEVPLRSVPELAFKFDRSTENAMRIDELLAGLPELQKDKE